MRRQLINYDGPGEQLTLSSLSWKIILYTYVTYLLVDPISYQKYYAWNKVPGQKYIVIFSLHMVDKASNWLNRISLVFKVQHEKWLIEFRLSAFYLCIYAGWVCWNSGFYNKNQGFHQSTLYFLIRVNLWISIAWFVFTFIRQSKKWSSPLRTMI